MPISQANAGVTPLLVLRCPDNDLYRMSGQTGIILFYLVDKGYGYIRLHGTHEEFHFRAKNVLAPGLKKGDMVKFQLKQGRQGYFADEILLAGIS